MLNKLDSGMELCISINETMPSVCIRNQISKCKLSQYNRKAKISQQENISLILKKCNRNIACSESENQIVEC